MQQCCNLKKLFYICNQDCLFFWCLKSSFVKGIYLKNIIAQFLLVLFISTKMISLHVFLHEDEKEEAPHCIVCDHVLINNHLTPVIPIDGGEITFKSIAVFVARDCNIHYQDAYVASTVPSQLFSRPPPVS